MAAGLACLATACVLNASQPPTPTPSPQSAGEQRQGGSSRAAEQQGQQQGPPGTKLGAQLPAGRQREEPERQAPRQDSESSPENIPAWIQAAAAVVMIGLTIALCIVAFEQKRAADTQAAVMSQTLAAMKTTDRAYVSLSHRPPGLTFHSDAGEGPWDVRIHLCATNTGNTPADVIDSSCELRITDTLYPHRPDAPAPNKRPIFTLMPKEQITLWQNLPVPSLEHLSAIESGKLKTYVVAWIVYRDRFGDRHRTGYARRYLPGENNLIFPDEADYNYEEDI